MRLQASQNNKKKLKEQKRNECKFKKKEIKLNRKQTEIFKTHKYPRSGSWMGKTDESLVNNKGNKERKLKCTK